MVQNALRTVFVPLALSAFAAGSAHGQGNFERPISSHCRLMEDIQAQGMKIPKNTALVDLGGTSDRHRSVRRLDGTEPFYAPEDILSCGLSIEEVSERARKDFDEEPHQEGVAELERGTEETIDNQEAQGN